MFKAINNACYLYCSLVIFKYYYIYELFMTILFFKVIFLFLNIVSEIRKNPYVLQNTY